MFKSLKQWLGIEPLKPRVGFRPHRTVDVPAPYDVVYDRTHASMVAVLGANVRDADRKTGIIDAEFGMVNSERIRATVERIDDENARVYVEARYPASATPPERSRAVDALAASLMAASAD
jgi:hypothetical protein